MSSTPSAEGGPAPALELSDVTVRFGGITALSEVGLTVRPGSVHGVIGPNGAGKTTLFNVACGFVTPDTGRIVREGTVLDKLAPHQLAGLSMARTLQGLGLFDRITVLDNVVVGADRHARSGFLGSLLALPRAGREEKALRERDYSRAAKNYERLLERLPKAHNERASIRLELARLYMRYLGQRERAIDHLREFVEQHPLDLVVRRLTEVVLIVDVHIIHEEHALGDGGGKGRQFADTLQAPRRQFGKGFYRVQVHVGHVGRFGQGVVH